MSAEIRNPRERNAERGRTQVPSRSDAVSHPDSTARRPTDDGRAEGDGRPETDGRSIPQLLSELSSEATTLVQNEVALAKAEMKEKVDVFQRNLVAMTIGGAFLLAALLFAAWAVNSGLTALLAEFMGLEIAVWLSPLILAAVLAAVGWGMVQKGKKAIAEEGITPHHTTSSLKEDKEWASSKAHEIKEEVKHG